MKKCVIVLLAALLTVFLPAAFTANAGIPQRAVDVWMGHAGDRSMGNVYYGLTDDESQSFMAKVPF